MSLRQAYRGGTPERSGEGWWLHFDYDEALVETLKAAVPARLRSWDEEKKRWWVSVEAEAEVLRILPALEAYRAQGSLL